LARKSENWLALHLVNEMGSLVVHKVPREGPVLHWAPKPGNWSPHWVDLKRFSAHIHSVDHHGSPRRNDDAGGLMLREAGWASDW